MRSRRRRPPPGPRGSPSGPGRAQPSGRLQKRGKKVSLFRRPPLRRSFLIREDKINIPGTTLPESNTWIPELCAFPWACPSSPSSPPSPPPPPSPSPPFAPPPPPPPPRGPPPHCQPWAGLAKEEEEASYILISPSSLCRSHLRHDKGVATRKNVFFQQTKHLN